MRDARVFSWKVGEFLVSLGGNDKKEEEDVVDPVRHPL